MINFSELLWKPRKLTRGESRSSGSGDAYSTETSAGLREVPVEEVQILPSTRIALVTDPKGPGADRFRYLRMRLRELRNVAKLRSIVVTSPLPEDGKSTVALNLATALADNGKASVLLMEGDLYHPTLAERLGLAAHQGLSECLEEGLDPMLALRRIEPLNWYLLPAGTPHGNPADLLQGETLPHIMERLAPHFDWIVIDSPPVTPLTDALSLSRQVDATLLVVRADRTPRGAIEEAIARLGSQHIVGIVVNAAEGLNHVYSKYYGYYSKK